MLLLDFFRNPESSREWSHTQWERLFQLARPAKLLGTLAYFIEDRGLWDAVPEKGRWFLESGKVKAERGRRQTLWEAECLRRATFGKSFVADAPEREIPLVLLKGAAYQAADLPWGRGRISVDVDVMTPIETLPQIEAALLVGGWLPEKKSEYDEHFYRDWMHEIPPMVHLDRGTTLDVHHTILPRTGRLTVDAALLFEEKELAADPSVLPDTVGRLLSDEGAEEAARMRENVTAFATPDANKLIYEDILELLKK